MIITDLMEYDGQNVRVELFNGQIYEGIIQYIPSYSEMYGWRKAHYFYIGENCFRCHYVRCVKPLQNT